MKTIRRDWLKRQIEQGKAEAKCNYHYTDDYAYDNAVGFGKTDWMPARVKAEPQYCEKVTLPNGVVTSHLINDDHKDGFLNFDIHDFKYSTGAAYYNDDGTIHFRPLSGESYTLRIKA